jgi:PBSX family phage terminase large subunit
MSAITVNYVASPTLAKFHKSEAFIRTVIGPIGSGKSVGCVFEMLMKSMIQKPSPAGIRKSRWVIIRNTYRELIDTTIETFFTWVPQSCGKWSNINMKFILAQQLNDGTKVHAEFLFRALDKPTDVKKLLSLDLTGGWINECREVPKAIMEMLIGRLGRFPRMIEGGPSWWGLIMDTNPPDSDHWYYKLFEENLPENYAIFHQPSGLSKEAENIKNLPPNYYKNMIAGKDQEWVNVYVHGKYGFIADGKPVYSEYNDNLHYSDEVYVPDPKKTLYIGLDFGLTPAALFSQKTASGCMVSFDELVTSDMGAKNFGRYLKERLNTKYRDFNVEIYGDPAGEDRAQTDEMTPFLILSALGIHVTPAHSNDFTIRREVVADYLGRLDFSGNPAFRITSGAPIFRRAMAGGYKYKRVQVAGEEKYQDKPNKNKFSHVAEAGQYMFLGAVGDDRVVGGFDNTKTDYSSIDNTIV